MYSYDDPDERVSVVQLNSELRHAQLELVSAHCATHQLRLRYSTDHLARFGRRDILRKSAEAASALHEFYQRIEKRMPACVSNAGGSPQPTGDQIAQAVQWLSDYLRQQRERHFSQAGPLAAHHRSAFSRYFQADLLDRVRVVELEGARIEVPEFFAKARAL